MVFCISAIPTFAAINYWKILSGTKLAPWNGSVTEICSDSAGTTCSSLAGGSGDVVGPASSIDSEVALFNSTTGKLLKAATISGLTKLTSGVLSAAVAGTDYIATETDPIVGAITGLIKADGGGNISQAISGTDYVVPAVTALNALATIDNTLSGIVKAASGVLGAAVDGTDYLSPTTGMLKSVYDPDTLGSDYIKRIYNGMSTSLISPGLLSINADNTKFDVAAGTGRVIDNYTDPTNPTYTEVSFGPFTAITPTYLTTELGTLISVDSAGALVHREFLPNTEQRRDTFLIGVISHVNKTNIDAVDNFTDVTAIDPQLAISDISEALSVVNKEGNAYSANGANLKIDRSEGTSYFYGFNYQTNKKNPNFITQSAQTPVTFTFSWDDGAGDWNSLSGQTDLVPGSWDDGTGGVGTPNGTVQSWQYQIFRLFYTPDANQTFIQYGQKLYSNLTSAINSITSENFEVNSLFEGMSYRGAIVVKGDATDLSDTNKAYFQNAGLLGEFSSGPSKVNDGVTNMHNYANGTVIDEMSQTITESGGTVTFNIERKGTGDLVVQFDGKDFDYDTTPADTIALPAGSDIAATLYYVYLTESGGTVTLNKNTTGMPSTTHAPLATVKVQSAAGVNTDGVYKHHMHDNSLGDGTGGWEEVTSWIRDQHATYKSGVAPTFSGDGTGTIGLATTSGIVRQFRNHTFPVFSDPATIFAVNDPDTANRKITNIADLQKDSTGASLTNRTYALVFWGVVNENTGDSKIFVNLPSGSEGLGKQSQIREDKKKETNYSIPEDYKGTAFLLYRLVIENNSDTTWDIDVGGAGDNLRGQFPNTVAGTSTAIGAEFPDSTFRVQNVADTTKEIAFDLSGNTTSILGTLATAFTTNKTITFPDIAGTVALTSEIGGGTGQSTYTTGDVLYSDASNSLAKLGIGSEDDVLSVSAGGIPEWVAGGGGGGFTFGDSDTGTSGDGLSINEFGSPTQATGLTRGYVWGTNFNTNSSNFSRGIFLDLEDNASTGFNSGVYIDHNGTNTVSGNGAIVVRQLGAGGTAQYITGGANVNSTANGLFNVNLSSTQSGASDLIVADMSSSAQAHAGITVKGSNASSSADAFLADMQTGYTGDLFKGSVNSVDKFTVNNDGKIGINLDPATNIHIADSMTPSSLTSDTYSTTSTHSSNFTFRKSASATIGTIAETADDEILGTVIFKGVDTGSGFGNASLIQVKQNGVSGASFVPANFLIFTSDGTSNWAERLKIDKYGVVSIITSGFVLNKVTADPCGDTNAFPEAGQFYNDTSDYFCFCDGAGDDKRLDAPATDCF